MTQTPAAGWFADPEDASQYRYWDGTAWTDHRAPRGPAAPSTADQFNATATQVADGIARGFDAVGAWARQQASSTPTFASVAASCRDEPARQPLSVSAEVVASPAERAAWPRLGPVGASVVCRLVPNPWDPATPQGVAVFVGAVPVGRLPAELEAAYCPRLATLASGGVVTTGTAELGDPLRVHLPAVEAFSAS